VSGSFGRLPVAVFGGGVAAALLLVEKARVAFLPRASRVRHDSHIHDGARLPQNDGAAWCMVRNHKEGESETARNFGPAVESARVASLKKHPGGDNFLALALALALAPAAGRLMRVVLPITNY